MKFIFYISKAHSVAKTVSFTPDKLLPAPPERMLFPQFGLRTCFVCSIKFWQNYQTETDLALQRI